MLWKQALENYSLWDEYTWGPFFSAPPKKTGSKNPRTLFRVHPGGEKKHTHQLRCGGYRRQVEKSIRLLFDASETFDVGMDLGAPVSLLHLVVEGSAGRVFWVVFLLDEVDVFLDSLSCWGDF